MAQAGKTSLDPAALRSLEPQSTLDLARRENRRITNGRTRNTRIEIGNRPGDTKKKTTDGKKSKRLRSDVPSRRKSDRVTTTQKSRERAKRHEDRQHKSCLANTRQIQPDHEVLETSHRDIEQKRSIHREEK